MNMANNFKKVIPPLNRVMIKKWSPKTTASGITFSENKEPL